MALKENYKDDILDVSVNTKRKYRMTENPDGTISLEDETVYTQEGDSFGASDMNTTNGKVNTLDANLDGFKFYPTGTDIVGLIADDSAYIDENGNYVIWGTQTAEQLVEDNPNTYKSVPSAEETHGKVGADTCVPFKSGGNGVVCFVYTGGYYEYELILNNKTQYRSDSRAYTLTDDGLTLSITTGDVYSLTATLTSDRRRDITFFIGSNTKEIVTLEPNVPYTFSNRTTNYNGFY